MRAGIPLEQRDIAANGSNTITLHQHRAMLDELIMRATRDNGAIAYEDVWHCIYYLSAFPNLAYKSATISIPLYPFSMGMTLPAVPTTASILFKPLPVTSSTTRSSCVILHSSP